MSLLQPKVKVICGVKLRKLKKRRKNIRIELDYYLDDDPYPDSLRFDVLHFWKLDPK